MRQYIRVLLASLMLAVWGSPLYALDQVSGPALLQNAVGATADGLALNVTGYRTVGVELTSTLTATVTWEGTAGSTWYAIPCTNKTSGTAANTATASGLYVCNVAGLTAFRGRVSSWTSGAVSVLAQATTSGN